jgi:hypothetical protein
LLKKGVGWRYERRGVRSQEADDGDAFASARSDDIRQRRSKTTGSREFRPGGLNRDPS